MSYSKHFLICDYCNGYLPQCKCDTPDDNSDCNVKDCTTCEKPNWHENTESME